MNSQFKWLLGASAGGMLGFGLTATMESFAAAENAGTSFAKEFPLFYAIVFLALAATALVNGFRGKGFRPALD